MPDVNAGVDADRRNGFALAASLEGEFFDTTESYADIRCRAIQLVTTAHRKNPPAVKLTGGRLGSATDFR